MTLQDRDYLLASLPGKSTVFYFLIEHKRILW